MRSEAKGREEEEEVADNEAQFTAAAKYFEKNPGEQREGEQISAGNRGKSENYIALNNNAAKRAHWKVHSVGFALRRFYFGFSFYFKIV